MPKTDLTIIIINYNTKVITYNCLKSVVTSLELHNSLVKTSKSTSERPLEVEIIVLDNNSTDGSKRMLEKFQTLLQNDEHIFLHLIFSHENLGFGAGNNRAVESAIGETILLLNSDIVVIGDAIPKLYKQFIQKPQRFDIAGATLRNKDMSLQPSACRFYTLFNTFVALFLKGDSWGFTRTSPRKITKVDWIYGACMMMKRKTFESLGGFDKEIFMYFEEVDLQYRATKNNYTIGFYPEPEFIHLEGASSKNRSAPILKIYSGFIYFYKKHFSSLKVIAIQYMLRIKALISMLIGYTLNNRYLIDTYKEAYEITKKG